MRTALILSISLVIGFASSVSAKPAQGSKCPERFAEICVVDGNRQTDPTEVSDDNRIPQPEIKTKSSGKSPCTCGKKEPVIVSGGR